MCARSQTVKRPAIQLNSLTVRRGGSRIVERLDLRIEPGRVLWIVGPNGAGKSSLLRVIAGLDPPARGSVRHEPPPGPRPAYFHSDMRIPAPARVSAWERLARRLAAEESGLTERTSLWPAVQEGRRVGGLSSGERKRLLLDVLLRQPGPLILDEPLEHLSPDAKTSLVRLLRARGRGEIVVVATNQRVRAAEHDGGLRLEGGAATPIGDRGGSP